jgi:hypothetical protein
MKNPKLAFKDNEDKLQKSRDQVRVQYEDFMHLFGADEVFGSGHEILKKYQAFFDSRIISKRSWNI